MVAAKVINFRAPAAWTGLAHLPEVIRRAELGKMIVRHVFQPVRPGFLVPGHAALAAKDRDIELVRGDLPDLGQQLPREADRLFFEVIAEGEIAEHLEKRVMARRRPDVLEVVVLSAHPHAFLARRSACVLACFSSQEEILELVHAGIGE